MKIWVCAVVAASVSFVQSDRAWAQDEPDRLLRLNMGFNDANYYFCTATSRDAPRAIQVLTEVVTTDARVTLYQMLEGIGAVAHPLPGRPWRDVRCHENSGGGSNTFQTRQAAEDYRASWISSARGQGTTIVEIPWPGKLGKFDKGYVATRKSPPRSESSPEMGSTINQTPRPLKAAPAPSKYVEVTGPDGATIRLSPEVAARNQAAAEAYRREMEAHARAKAEHDRKLTEHQDNAAKAAAAMQAHGAKLAANAAEVAAHKAAMDDYQKKLAGKASTDDDPNRCITSPEIKPGLRGNTEVRVTNGCDQKVDIVICLKRTTGDWLCGANFGILSQRSMTFMSTNATGEIYVDAVTFGSRNKLGRPAGIIK
jgi:hypothetical protein